MHASRKLCEVSERVRVETLLHIAYLEGFRQALSQLMINLSISVEHDLLDVLKEMGVRRSYMEAIFRLQEKQKAVSEVKCRDMTRPLTYRHGLCIWSMKRVQRGVIYRALAPVFPSR